MRLVHAKHVSHWLRVYSTSPLRRHNFRSCGSPRISEMIGRSIASPPASMSCLASTALGSSNCHGVPFKSQTQQCTSILPATTSEASSFHDAFARHRKNASCVGLTSHTTFLDHSRLMSGPWILGKSWPQANSLSELKRCLQPLLPCPSLLSRLAVFSDAISCWTVCTVSP